MKSLTGIRRRSMMLPFMLFPICIAPFLAAFAAEVDYVDASKCKLCHNKTSEGAQYNVWKQMRHAHAFETLLGERAITVAKERGLQAPPSESMECLQCHLTAYDVKTKSHPPQLKKESGVQCGSCHGPGATHMEDGKKLRMDKDADVDISANILRPDKNTCVVCHNDRNPTWDPKKYTLDSGEKAGFDFEQAFSIINHNNPKKAR